MKWNGGDETVTSDYVNSSQIIYEFLVFERIMWHLSQEAFEIFSSLKEVAKANCNWEIWREKIAGVKFIAIVKERCENFVSS